MSTLRLELAGDARFDATSSGATYRLHLLHQTMVNPDRVAVRVRLTQPWTFGDTAHAFVVHGGDANYQATLTERQTLALTVDESKLRASR